MLCIFAPAVAHAGLLPDGYKRLEYIENAANTYLNTGIIPQTDDIEMEILNDAVTGSNYLFLSRATSTSASSGISGSTTGNGINILYNGVGATSAITRVAGNNYYIKATFKDGRATLYVKDNTNNVDNTVNGTYTFSVLSYPFGLFGNTGGNRLNAGARIYYARIKVGGKYVMNYIPAKYGNSVGFYDTVSKTFKTATTGKFIAGPEIGIKIATKAYNDAEFNIVQTALNNARTTVSNVVSGTVSQSSSIGTLATSKQNRPTTDCPQYRQCMLVQDANNQPTWFPIVDPFYDLFKPIITQGYSINVHNTSWSLGYRQLDYIQSNGSQWIDTDITGAAIWQLSAQSNAVTGSANTVLVANYHSGSTWFGALANGYWGAGATSGYYTDVSNTTKADIIVNFAANKISGTVNSVAFTRSGANNSFGTSYYLFNTPATGHPFKGKLWKATCIQNDVLVRNMVPAQCDDGLIGMYDTVSQRFFQDAAGGNFTAGNFVTNTDVPAEPTWTVEVPENQSLHIMGGTVYGIAKCNSVSAAANDIATSANLQSSSWTTTGNYCWCSIKSVDANGNAGIHENSAWVFVESNSNCASQCSQICATTFAGDTIGAFRGALSGIQ